MKLKLFLLTITLSCSLAVQTRMAFGQTSSDPELPRYHVDTTYPNQTGGDIHKPLSGTQFQSLLNGGELDDKVLKQGDTIELKAGIIYTGNFTLPYKSGSGWIIIRTSDMAGIAADGNRINPTTQAAAMPIIETTNDLPAIDVVMNAQGQVPHNYRLVGLEIRLATTTPSNTSGLVRIGSTEATSVDQLPANIIIDRCYIHGRDGSNILKNGVRLNATYSAVIGSNISECIGAGDDIEAMAIYVAIGGPLKIENNYLEAMDENILIGGIKPSGSAPHPSDIEIQHNHFFKQLSWGPAGYRVKNLLEFKNANHVRINGNIFENNWSAYGQSNAQDGAAILLKTDSAGGTCSSCVTEHITFTNNIVRHSQNGLRISAGATGEKKVNHVKIENVLFYDLNHYDPQHVFNTDEVAGRIYYIFGGATEVQIIHTTAEGQNHTLRTFGLESNLEVDIKNKNFTFRDNIVERGSNGIKGTGYAEGTDTLNQYFNPYTYLKNVLVSTTLNDDDPLLGLYPSTCPSVDQACAAGQTFVASNWESVGFTIGDDQTLRQSTGNYSLASTSPYANQASDKNTSAYKDIGIDQVALNAATSCVISGLCADVELHDVWTNFGGGATASGNDLTKSSGTVGWNAGATSIRKFSGDLDGYVEFSTNENTTAKMAGLNHDHVGHHYTEIDYAISLSSTAKVRIYENGTPITNPATNTVHFGTYVAGDRFRVSVENDVVKYYQNGTLFYTSAQPPIYPLVLDASLYTPGATIIDAVVAMDVIWVNLLGVTASGNDLTKTGAGGWNAGATSVQTIPGSDGYVEFSTDENTTAKMAGLNHDHVGHHYTEIDYAIFLNPTGNVRIYENGAVITNPATNTAYFGTYVAGDRFRVSVEDDVVKYYQNGTLLHTSAQPPIYPLVLDASLNTTGATITDAMIVESE